ncbi:BTAD domain-containing putative transcriptional regulator [Streptomyces althioticus]|uniref:BTAD domain-containing putative transcriptional regulator n=1 Tax=Streptomyces althioticus TaxID=83380 RepID=UPI00331CFC75
MPAFRAATLYPCGRRAGALHVLASARARMTAHLGLGPTRELKDLWTTLLRDGPV